MTSTNTPYIVFREPLFHCADENPKVYTELGVNTLNGKTASLINRTVGTKAVQRAISTLLA